LPEQVLIMSSTRRRNARMLALLGSLLAAMAGMVAYSPTLYQIFRAATGCGTRPDERIGDARRQPEAQPA
jgi:hypothetical protein